jgi:hypothetical protein
MGWEKQNRRVYWGEDDSHILSKAKSNIGNSNSVFQKYFIPPFVAQSFLGRKSGFPQEAAAI